MGACVRDWSLCVCVRACACVLVYACTSEGLCVLCPSTMKKNSYCAIGRLKV